MWQPIETAPNEVVILCANMKLSKASKRVYVAWLDNGKVCGYRMDMPTHWQPLPDTECLETGNN